MAVINSNGGSTKGGEQFWEESQLLCNFAPTLQTNFTLYTQNRAKTTLFEEKNINSGKTTPPFFLCTGSCKSSVGEKDKIHKSVATEQQNMTQCAKSE